MSQKFLVPIQLPADPTQPLEAATKAYVDQRDVPVGGTAGQVLTKADGTDYNYAWSDPTGGGGTGSSWEPVVAMGGF